VAEVASCAADWAVVVLAGDCAVVADFYLFFGVFFRDSGFLFFLLLSNNIILHHLLNLRLKRRNSRHMSESKRYQIDTRNIPHIRISLLNDQLYFLEHLGFLV